MSTTEIDYSSHPPSPCCPGSIVLPASANPTADTHPEEHGKAWICSACLTPFDVTEDEPEEP